MHRTEGDGYIVDSGKKVFADENPPVRDATQLRHQEANAWQEEICNVIEAESIVLNLGSENISEMIQLNTAIDKKIMTLSDSVDTDIQNILWVLNALKASNITNDSNINGTKVKDALNWISNYLNSLAANQVINNSNIVGTNLQDALNTIKNTIDSLKASDITNDSSVNGTKVKDALDNLANAQDVTTVKVGSAQILWSGVATGSVYTLDWKTTQYVNGTKKVELWLPDIDTTVALGAGGIKPVSFTTNDGNPFTSEILPSNNEVLMPKLENVYLEDTNMSPTKRFVQIYTEVGDASTSCDSFDLWSIIGNNTWVQPGLVESTNLISSGGYIVYYV